jgi:hypothetical protein
MPTRRIDSDPHNVPFTFLPRLAGQTFLDARNQAREFGGRFLLLVTPEPVNAVDIETMVIGRRIGRCLVRQFHVPVEHLDKDVRVCSRIGRPHEIRMVVVGDVSSRSASQFFLSFSPPVMFKFFVWDLRIP